MRDYNTSFILKGDELKKFVEKNDYRSNSNYDIERYIDDINSAIRYFDNELNQITHSVNVIGWYDINCDKDKYAEIIQYLTNKKNELFIDRINVKNLLYEKQKKCDHKEESVRYIGHDHNYNYYVCDKCGKETKE